MNHLYFLLHGVSRLPAGDGRNLACFSIWGTCADRGRAPLPWRSRDLPSGLLILIGCRAPWAASSGGLCPPTVPTVAPTLVLVCSRRGEKCTRAWVTRTTEVHCLPVWRIETQSQGIGRAGFSRGLCSRPLCQPPAACWQFGAPVGSWKHHPHPRLDLPMARSLCPCLCPNFPS